MKKIVSFMVFFSAFAYGVNTDIQADFIKFGDFTNFDKKLEISQNEIIKCDTKLNGIYESRIEENKNYIYFFPNNGEKFNFQTNKFEISEFEIIKNGFAVVKFNDFVDLENLKQNLRIYKKENMSKNDISYQINSQNNRIFFINFDEKTKDINLEISKNLTSKFGIKLNETAIKSSNDINFKDNIKAIDLEKNDILIRGASFDDGSVGARIYLKNYMQPSFKFVKINGISKLNLTSPEYLYHSLKENDSELENFWYFIDVKSDEIQTNKDYKITILKGFGDEYKLARKDYEFDFKTGDRKAFITFSDDKKYISKNAIISFKSANVSEVTLLINKIEDYNLRYFLNFNHEDYDIDKFLNEKLSKKFALNGDKNSIKEHKINFDFKDYEDGIYKISAVFLQDGKLQTVSKIAYLSDISANVSISDDEMFILTTRLSTGEILPKTKVQVFSDKNNLIFEGKSDSDGILRIKNKDKKASILLQNGDERGFVMLDEPVVRKNKSEKDIKTLLYFSSELVYPNENLSGVLVFKKSDFNALKDIPVKLKIYDSKNIEVLNKNAKTDEFGTVLINEKIGQTTGIYKFEVIFENEVLASKNFSVENFIANRVRNSILTDKDEYFENEVINASLMSNYLLGAPAGGLNGSLMATFLDDEGLKFDDYKDFSFTNHTLKSENNENKTINEVDFTLNKNGEKKVIIPMPSNITTSNSYKVLLQFSTNDNGKIINSYKRVSVFPYARLTGILSDKDFINSKESVKFSLISLDSKDKKPLNTNLDIEIYRNDFNYIYDSGRYVEQNDFILVDSFKTDKKEIEYKFENGGEYIVVAKDYLSGSSASVSVDVSGWGYNTNLNPKKAKQAKIKLQKDMYKSGEVIKGVVRSQIEKGILNISLVGKEIYDFQIQKIDGGNGEFELKIPDNFTGGYINASIFRDAKPNSTPLRTFANIPIKIDNSDKKVQIAVKHEKEAKNGSNTQIDIKTKPNSKVVLFAVDMGILDIISQKELKAFDFFNTPNSYNFAYYDIFDELSTYFANVNELSFGGDMMVKMASLKRDMSPVEKQMQRQFVIMKSGNSNDNGEIKFDIKFPQDFNSEVRITALVIDENAIDSANSYIQIKDDIVIKPSQSLYLIKNDEINFSLTIINTTNSDKNLKLDISNSKNLEITGFKNEINLKPLESINIDFLVKALKLGSANIKIIADDNGDIYENNTNLTIISQYPASKFFKTGFIKEPKELNANDETYEKFYINVSQTPQAVSLADDLINYPYGCTEQTVSKMIANHYFYSQNHDQKLLDTIKNQAGIVLSRIKNDGKFGYWSAYGYTNEYVSIYAADVLLWLDEKYKFLNDKQKELIFSGLKNTINEPFLTMYSAFVLNRYKKLEKSEINRIYDNKIYENNLVSRMMMSVILQTNGMEKHSEELYKTIQENVNLQIYNYNDLYFESDIKNKAFILFIAANMQKKDYFLDSIVADITRHLEVISNTQERGFVVRAFDEYFKNIDEGANFSLAFDDKKLDFKTQISRSFYIDNGRLNIIPNDENGLFYSVLSFGYEKVTPKHDDFNANAIRMEKNTNKKLKIFREFVDKNGKKVDLNSLKVGDKIFSKVRIFANFYAYNLAVDEPISSCFEIVNERLYPNERTKATNDKIRFAHKEYLHDRVLHFPETFSDEIVFFTPINVVKSGNCRLPAIKTEYMQSEKINDYDLETLEFKVGK